MSIVVRFTTALTSEKYDESVRRLEAAGACLRTDSTTTSALGPKGICS